MVIHEEEYSRPSGRLSTAAVSALLVPPAYRIGQPPRLHGNRLFQAIFLRTDITRQFEGEIQQVGNDKGIKRYFRPAPGFDIDGFLASGEDFGLVPAIENSQGKWHCSGKIREIVNATDDTNVIAFPQERGRFDFDEKVLARECGGGRLSDECLHRASARRETPGGGGFRHRDGGHGLAVSSGDDRWQPTTFPAHFAAGAARRPLKEFEGTSMSCAFFDSSWR